MLLLERNQTFGLLSKTSTRLVGFPEAASAGLGVASIGENAAIQTVVLRVIAVADGASVEVEAELGYLTCAAAGLYDQDFAVDYESESAAAAAEANFEGDFSEADY